jgi:hypothetical protein
MYNALDLLPLVQHQMPQLPRCWCNIEYPQVQDALTRRQPAFRNARSPAIESRALLLHLCFGGCVAPGQTCQAK